MTTSVEKAALTDLEILGFFDAVQRWLVGRGLKGQWGDAPFFESQVQRERFAAWLEAGSLFAVRLEGRIIGTVVFSPAPPDYAQAALAGRVAGGYFEAFAVHRDYAGQGVGAALLGWAGAEAKRE